MAILDLLAKAETGMVLAGIPLVPVIVYLVQMIKRFWPQADSRLWYALTFVLGALGETAVDVLAYESQPWTLRTTMVFVVMVILGGLAAGKAYDDQAAAGHLASASQYRQRRGLTG